ncbi:glycosyltransferase [Salinicoccus sesuvii]|uniref:Glycosyltransferase n=1 Tax=Salinicoccus sesuvii TaxID=868281 RepID=A0ABV7N8C8_9STAP
MQKKKVLFFIYQMGAGGAARTFLNILNNIDRAKFTPILVTLDYNGGYETYIKDDVKIIKLPTKRLRSAILPLAKTIRKEKVDIVFSTIPNYNVIAILGTILSFSRAKNVVREAAFLGGSLRENIKLRVVGKLYKHADRVVALSKGVQDNIINRYKVNPKKISVIYNPVDVDGIQRLARQDDIRAEDKEILKRASKIVVTAGRLVADKDHRTLINAFSKVQSRINDAHLVILGEGILEEELKQLVRKLELEEYVHFFGFQKNPYAYFQAADLFVLSSVREGFGHVLAEALSTGTPIVSTDARPGASEVLDYGVYGEMCPRSDSVKLADKICSMLLLSDEEQRDIVEKGIERANHFHVDKIVRQYENMFLHILEEKHS